MEKLIKSPLAEGTDAFLYSQIQARTIVELYKSDLGIDVSRYFENEKEIGIYQCKSTGVLFYYPYSLAGDEVFYKELSHNTQYYPSIKKEFITAAGFLSASDKILEVGCGEGFFLDILKSKQISQIQGLELNSEAASKARAKGHTILNNSIQELAKTHTDAFDSVIMFQVLEHVSGIKEFLEAVMKILKPGGKLIIGVPYNNPYYAGYDKYQVMNLPPHHMVLWSPESLKKLCTIFPLEVFHYELEYMPVENILYQLKLNLKKIFRGQLSVLYRNFRQNIIYLFHLMLRPFGKGWAYNNQVFIFRKTS